MSKRHRSPGEGTIIRRRDGRWAAALQVGGKRRWVYGVTRAEVVAKLNALKRQVTGGQLPDPGRRTVQDLLTAWLDVVRPRLRPSTLDSYRRVIETHITPAMGTVRLSRLSPARLQALYADLVGQGKERTAAKVHAVLRRAFRLGVKWGWVGDDITQRVEAPRYRPERRPLWGVEDLRTFLAGAQSHPLFGLFAFLLASGCRLGEALGLRWEDISPLDGTVTIQRSVHYLRGQLVVGRPKTRSGERTVALPHSIIALLGFSPERQGWVFAGRDGQPLRHDVVEKAMRRLCHGLGLQPITPHQLRHLHASLLLAGGLPLPNVSKRLGHANTQVTAAVYSHALPGRDREAVRLLEATIGGER